MPTEATINFRFNRLDKMQAFTLVREIIGSSYQAHSEENYYVGLIPLTKKSLDDINDFYVRQQVNIDDTDIHISINGKSPSAEFNIPVIVNRMLKYIDCQLTIAVK